MQRGRQEVPHFCSGGGGGYMFFLASLNSSSVPIHFLV